jgi:hypothetical protein
MANLFIAGGNKVNEIGFYDTNGLFCAGVTSLAAGASAPMRRFYALKEATATQPVKERVNQTGDDILRGFLTFDSIEPLVIEMTVGAHELDMAGDVQNINAVADSGIVTMLPINPAVLEYPRVMFFSQGTAKKDVFGTDASVRWHAHMFNAGELVFRGADSLTERALRQWAYTYTAEQTSKWPWGSALTAFGTEAVAGAEWISDKLVTFHAYRGDSALADDTLALPYLAAGTHITAGVFDIWQTVVSTGVTTKLAATTGFTVANSTISTITFAAATTGNHYVVRYKRA